MPAVANAQKIDLSELQKEVSELSKDLEKVKASSNIKKSVYKSKL